MGWSAERLDEPILETEGGDSKEGVMGSVPRIGPLRFWNIIRLFGSAEGFTVFLWDWFREALFVGGTEFVLVARRCYGLFSGTPRFGACHLRAQQY